MKRRRKTAAAGLTGIDHAAIIKAVSAGSGDMAITLSEDDCNYLVAVIANDLGYSVHFPELPTPVPAFFTATATDIVRYKADFDAAIVKLHQLEPSSINYFCCLARLHRARLKYANILRRQALPTMDQVGPRGLLQYGSTSPRALTGLLFWRKWIFDIDNRAAQETGYLFEPIIASSIGGVPYSDKRSPIRRRLDPRKGRQVDCLLPPRAYEIKLRVTIAASGQGRWGEELDFPADCNANGHIPVLIVFDPTANDKLAEIAATFKKYGGEVYIGEDAWEHLERTAGRVMAKFLELYVREPIEQLLAEVPEDGLPDMEMEMSATHLRVTVAGESIIIEREPLAPSDDHELPEDVDIETPGE